MICPKDYVTRHTEAIREKWNECTACTSNTGQQNNESHDCAFHQRTQHWLHYGNFNVHFIKNIVLGKTPCHCAAVTPTNYASQCTCTRIHYACWDRDDLKVEE